MAAIVATLTSESPSLSKSNSTAQVLNPEDVIRGPFEGVEKRLIIQFEANFLATSRCLADGSLRSLPNETWTAILEHASCQILNRIELNSQSEERRGCTAYLLSESSLFVFDSKIILKTCGTTTPLLVVPILLQLLGSTKLGFCTSLEALFATKKMRSLCTSGVDKDSIGVSFDDLSTRPPTSDYSACSVGETSPSKIISLLSLSAASSPSTTMDSELCEASDVSEGDVEGVRSAETHRVSGASQGVSYLFFSHMNYCFPELQRFPHRSFDEEVSFLDNIFGEQISVLNRRADFFTLKSSPDREFFCYGWRQHLERDGARNELECLSVSQGQQQEPPRFESLGETMGTGREQVSITELIMLDIEETSVSSVAGNGHGSSTLWGTYTNPTEDSKHPEKSLVQGYVGKLAQMGSSGRQAELDEYWFEPCGYSCNALIPCGSTEDDSSSGYFTCHISPEPESSYASWEVSLLPDKVNEAPLVRGNIPATLLCFSDVTAAFKPRSAHVIEISLSPAAGNLCQSRSLGGSDCSLTSEQFGIDTTREEALESEISCQQAEFFSKAGVPYRLVSSLRRDGAWFSVFHMEFRAVLP